MPLLPLSPSIGKYYKNKYGYKDIILFIIRPQIGKLENPN